MVRMKIDTWKVKLIMAKNGWTRVDVAAFGDFTNQTFGNILKEGTCTPKIAGKLAKGLGVEITDIVIQD